MGGERIEAEQAGTQRDGLERFLQAQEGTYEQALAEICDGRKRSHWMWFVFPQMRGLGRTDTAWLYGIQDESEAREYLGHAVLGARIAEISRAVLSHAGDGVSAQEMFGFPDVLKLKSSMTLFDAVSDEPGNVFGQVLDAFYGGERDDATLSMLGL